MPPRPNFGPPGNAGPPMGQRPPGYGGPIMTGPRPGQPGQMVNLPHRQGPAGKKKKNDAVKILKDMTCFNYVFLFLKE